MCWERISLCFIMCSIFILSSCSKDEDTYELSQEQYIVLKTVPSYAIIAHRGTGEWAPEGTEAAMRWARNVGATYLECDVRRTKDGYLVVFHNSRLKETSNIKNKFPNSEEKSIEDFTLEELLTLDFGSWFNERNKTLARKSFINLDILTLEDVIKIAEGYRIKRNEQHKRIYTKVNEKIIMQYEPDPADNGNRPGIYPETKSSELYPGIELDIKNELERLGWYANNISELKQIDVQPGKVSTANTPARVIIQSLSEKSLSEFKKILPRLIPLCYLININKSATVTREQYETWINTAIKSGAVILGPSVAGGIYDFNDMLLPWMHDLIKEKKMLIHAYTFNDEEQFTEYFDRADGFITGQVRLIKKALQLKSILAGPNSPYEQTESQILDNLGY